MRAATSSSPARPIHRGDLRWWIVLKISFRSRRLSGGTRLVNSAREERHPGRMTARHIVLPGRGGGTDAIIAIADTSRHPDRRMLVDRVRTPRRRGQGTAAGEGRRLCLTQHVVDG